MVFSTPLFLFVYLSLTLLLYYAVPLKGRNLALLAVSLFFYAWGERIYVVIMVASTLIDYTHGMLVERCKARGNDRGARWAVASSVFFNLALLGFFKYWDFLAASFQAVGLNFMPVLNVHLPIGISFYTFQTMSYTIDVYRGDARAQRSLVNFGTFVTLFPQLIAGPIIKYKDLGDQIDSRDLHRGEVCLRRPDVRHRPGKKGAHRQQRGHAVGELTRPWRRGTSPWPGPGWACWPLPSRSTLTSPAIPIWR